MQMNSTNGQTHPMYQWIASILLQRDMLRGSTFRLAIRFSLAFIFSTMLLFSFIYWQTAVVETKRVENELEKYAEAIAKDDQQDIKDAVRFQLLGQNHRIAYMALFSPDGRRIVGNLEKFPIGVPADGSAHRRTGETLGDADRGSDDVLIVRRQLADGRSLVIGRSLDSLDNLRTVVMRALRLGTIATVVLALAAGAGLSRRAQEQIKAVRLTAERIIQGHLSDRLPTRGSGDDFDRLAEIVNHMLDEMERLLGEMKTTTENIAHDLRTPLTRVRSRLERARYTTQTHEELREMVDGAVVSLDQTLRIITALLRIGQIEGGQRRASFSTVDLGTLVNEMGDLFEPLAEEKGIRFSTKVDTAGSVLGDPDLVNEAIANLLDNAIKFTPSGGSVELTLREEGGVPVVSVADDGPGIAPEERDAVMRRFYRSDKSRHIEGCGLGLSLVDAIVKLHGFRLAIRDRSPGCAFEIMCVPQESHWLAQAAGNRGEPVTTHSPARRAC